MWKYLPWLVAGVFGWRAAVLQGDLDAKVAELKNCQEKVDRPELQGPSAPPQPEAPTKPKAPKP